MPTAGYSGTPLARKLGIKENFKCHFVNRPDHYLELFDDLPSIQEIESPDNESLDFMHAFSLTMDELEVIGKTAMKALKKTGMLWVSWPKGASGIKTELNRDIIREYLLGVGLVDVKVAAVDEIWSGLKFVYRLKDR